MWLQELNFSFWKNDSQNWTLLFNMTRRMYPSVQYYSKNWTLFFEYDSKNWTLFSICLNRLIIFLKKKLKELNFFWIWLKELNFFIWFRDLALFEIKNTFFQKIERKKTHRIELSKKNELFFFEYDSHHWTFFGYDSKNGPFCNTTHRIEPFSLNMTTELIPLYSY